MLQFQFKNPTLFFLLLSLSLLHLGLPRCSFSVDQNLMPIKVDTPQFDLNGLLSCTEYNGDKGCCSTGSDQQQTASYLEIDSIFGSSGGGCDICAINLKRLWCQYACSPRQAQFTTVEKGLVPIPDPEKPGEMILVQKVELRVYAQTACDIFNSCKRVPFVASVSAMGSPAGFLNFQGHNAADDGHQDISMKFSYSKNDSLYFSDSCPSPKDKNLTSCNYTQPKGKLHQFNLNKNCSCNTCEASCSSSHDFMYTEPKILEGFNSELVGFSWLGVIGVVGILTVYRYRKERKGKNKRE